MASQTPKKWKLSGSVSPEVFWNNFFVDIAIFYNIYILKLPLNILASQAPK